MAKIKKVKGRQVFDSRGNPTVEAEVYSDNGSALAIVPSGASTGTHEAYELRDKDNKDYLGKSVLKAIENIYSEADCLPILLQATYYNKWQMALRYNDRYIVHTKPNTVVSN